MMGAETEWLTGVLSDAVRRNRRRLHLASLGLKQNLDDLHYLIEDKTGLAFGAFRTSRPDFKFVIRVGTGQDLVEFEAGLLGRGVYVGRQPC